MDGFFSGLFCTSPSEHWALVFELFFCRRAVWDRQRTHELCWVTLNDRQSNILNFQCHVSPRMSWIRAARVQTQDLDLLQSTFEPERVVQPSLRAASRLWDRGHRPRVFNDQPVKAACSRYTLGVCEGCVSSPDDSWMLLGQNTQSRGFGSRFTGQHSLLLLENYHCSSYNRNSDESTHELVKHVQSHPWDHFTKALYCGWKKHISSVLQLLSSFVMFHSISFRAI